ncbi:sugar transferase [Metabacillus sp. cB07]|uniref:sugar transferase n=1 Tax=Metabacillus sp. cB07 TaxID=2806989 RepID=UPI00193A159F|nr:sugar transferase [Metabacillus sp. cB07]
MKRLFDLTVSFSLIILFSPFFLIISFFVKVKLGSPILFKQLRPGLNGDPFQFYKFRTMTNERNAAGDLLDDQSRLTPLGTFLRKTSLDELPQLINVVRGDLSLVGPRPLLMEYLPLYNDEQSKRHLVKPGITGWAQINGRNSISWDEKFKLDVWYVDNHSFLLDIKILLITVYKVFRSQGINQQGVATVERFERPAETE